MSTTASNKDHLLFQEGEDVLCFHGPLMYDAKILDAEWWEGREVPDGAYYLVHYMGWKKKWDEWVEETRVHKVNEETRQRQAALKGGAAARKANNKASSSSSSSSSSSATTASGRSRIKSGEEGVEHQDLFLHRPEIRIPIPPALQAQLVQDFDRIARQHHLVPLPRHPNVRTILSMYRSAQHPRSGPPSLPADAYVLEFTRGLDAYFQRALPTLLLYRSEKDQLSLLSNPPLLSSSSSSPSDSPSSNSSSPSPSIVDHSRIYGAEHLLRLFVKLPKLLVYTDLGSEELDHLKIYLDDFLRWMLKNSSTLFLPSYSQDSEAGGDKVQKIHDKDTVMTDTPSSSASSS